MHLPFSCTDYLLFCMLNGWWYYWWTTSSTEVVSSVFPLYFDYPYYPPISYSTIHNNNIPLNNVIITNDWVDSIVPPFSLVKLALHAFFFFWGGVCTIVYRAPSEYLQVFVTLWLRFCIYSESLTSYLFRCGICDGVFLIFLFSFFQSVFFLRIFIQNYTSSLRH